MVTGDNENGFLNDFTLKFAPGQGDAEATTETAYADERSGRNYLFYDKELVLGINVALVTGRPLLLRGPSGTGKSSVAPAVARQMNFRFYDHVITSRTQARDLLFDIDYLGRLHDAQAARWTPWQRSTADYKPLLDYLNPGPLWRAIDGRSAARLGVKDGPVRAPDIYDDSMTDRPAVILLDEIDKAEPDVPNNLLVVLGSLRFDIEGTEISVTRKPGADPPLIVITSNEERRLSAAFTRRCAQVNLKCPGTDVLVDIALKHHPDLDPGLVQKVKELVDLRTKEPSVSPAEFLDVVRAAQRLSARRDDESLTRLVAMLTETNAT